LSHGKARLAHKWKVRASDNHAVELRRNNNSDDVGLALNDITELERRATRSMRLIRKLGVMRRSVISELRNVRRVNLRDKLCDKVVVIKVSLSSEICQNRNFTLYCRFSEL